MVDEGENGGPNTRGAVDEREVVAPGALVECAAREGKEVDDLGVGPALGEGGVEAARGGVVTLAIASGEEQDFRHAREWTDGGGAWQVIIARPAGGRWTKAPSTLGKGHSTVRGTSFPP